MPDDKSKRGPADRHRININEPYELDYWSNALGVTKARLIQLVAQHGDKAADIRRVLGQA